MTAPPPSRAVLAVVTAMMAVPVALPFARRDDWIGWVAFLALVGVLALIWGVMLWGWICRWREPPDAR